VILQFKAVEEIFFTRHIIAESSEQAFRGRLQHFQRIGFPDGVNTGRGKPAQYGWTQLFQLAFALDFVELGQPPEVAAKIVRENSDVLMAAVASMKPQLIAMEVSMLAHMKPEGHQEIAQIWVLSDEYIMEMLTKVGLSSYRPTIITNAGSVLDFILGQVARVTEGDHSEIEADLAEWAKEARKYSK